MSFLGLLLISVSDKTRKMFRQTIYKAHRRPPEEERQEFSIHLQIAMPYVTPPQRVNAINKLLAKGKIEILKQGGKLVYRSE